MFNRCLILILSSFSLYNKQILADDIFKVGVNLPLSGVAAEYGEVVRNGIEMAVAANPANFSTIRFLFEDNQYDSKRAIAAYHKLRLTDQVNLIFAWGEAPALAIAPVAEKDKFPLIALSTDPRSLRKFQYTVRFINSQSEYAEKLVTYLRTQGIKRIGMMMADDPYYTSYLAAIESHLLPGESVKVVGNYLPGEMDFKPAILKAKAAGYDIVGIFLFVGQISSFYRQAATLHYQPRTFGADDFESKTEIAASQGGMNNAVFALNKISEDFATRYRSRFGTDAHLTYAANGYDFANLVSQLLPWNADQTSAQMMTRLTQIKLPAGALGTAEFRQTNDGGRYFRFPVVIKKVVGLGVEVVHE